MTAGWMPQPYLIAHRAGNELGQLRAAQAQGVRVVEADLQLAAGRVEVRHARTVRRLPVSWDERRLRALRRPLLLGELLAATGEETELMLDLKGRDIRLSALVLGELGPDVERRPLTVCAREWHLLSPFAATPAVRVLHSIGTPDELQAFMRAFESVPAKGVSIRETLLDGSTMRLVRRRAGTVLAWTVNSPARARELARLGVDGLITDVPALLGEPSAVPALLAA
jgi:glycerophosphoryl diester phosphodiesterase